MWYFIKKITKQFANTKPWYLILISVFQNHGKTRQAVQYYNKFRIYLERPQKQLLCPKAFAYIEFLLEKQLFQAWREKSRASAWSVRSPAPTKAWQYNFSPTLLPDSMLALWNKTWREHLQHSNWQLYTSGLLALSCLPLPIQVTSRACAGIPRVLTC